MGRIRTSLVKTTGFKVYKKYKDKFTKEFKHNKKSLDEVAIINSKKLRNIIAGYITCLAKREKK